MCLDEYDVNERVVLGHILIVPLCFYLLDRRSGSSASPRRNKARLTPERSLDIPPRHSPSPKAHRLDGSPAEPVPNFAKVSANVKYPGLHNRGASREVGDLQSHACFLPVLKGILSLPQSPYCLLYGVQALGSLGSVLRDYFNCYQCFRNTVELDAYGAGEL